MTSELEKAYACLPDDAKLAVFAFSVLIERIKSLPKADRDDLFELFQELGKTDDAEERQSIRVTMEEILAQVPLGIQVAARTSEQKPLEGGLKKWANHVGAKIRELREYAGLTQTELAKISGLPQSHISRLENAEHSATHITLTKIANALGIEVGAIDPCIED
jgi:DNA-binding XRE family transcriptional regulator